MFFVYSVIKINTVQSNSLITPEDIRVGEGVSYRTDKKIFMRTVTKLQKRTNEVINNPKYN